jgi:hypothetical protein
MFFSEEKNQKTFMSCTREHTGHGRRVGAAPEIKVFCFLSSEKQALLAASGIVGK